MEDTPLTFNIEADEVEIFLQDVNEHLQAMEMGILRLERSPDSAEGQAADLDTLNSVFRAAHTLKAVAAAVGHQQMADLTHALETLFDTMREGRLSPTQAVADELLVTVDVLKALRDEVVSLQPSDVDVTTSLERLHALMGSVTGEVNEEMAQAVHSLAAQQRLTPEQAAQAHFSTDMGQGEDKTVRINVKHLDTLMNLVGELVADRTRLIQIEDALRAQYGKDETIGALGEMKTHFSRMIDRLQEEVMQARMLPIAHLFQKFPRLVRDLARDAGKQVELAIKGEATELDRSIIESIGDPLIHLLRNAVDHGIEPPDERIAAGKPATGMVWLTAGHEEDHVVITVKDDGWGIDPAQVRRAAVARGLLSEEEVVQLDDDAIIPLIFQPNLSTVEHITDVSGRGMGLDVVQTNVKRLSGAVLAESEVGRGTTFRLTLPLTLAILQTMHVAIGDDAYAIPLTGIVETLYLSDVAVGSVKGNPITHWRGSVLPLLYLRQFFAYSGETEFPSKQAVVVVAWGKQQIGLIVDKLIGKQETVVKSISPIVDHAPELSGCTILGNGRVALILDVPALVNTVMQTRR